MENSTSDQDLETSMEYMKFCAYVIEKEMQKFNLDFSVYRSFVTQLPGFLDVNFDIAYNRCAFMYKYTLCNIYFFKNCMNKFILECPEFKDLVLKWATDSNTSLCSLSCGPGLDYLSFMLALSDHSTFLSFKSVTVLAKYGAWRNTVGIVADAMDEGALSKCGIGKIVNFKNVEVVQASLLASNIHAKGLEALQKSSVVLMVKTLNLTAPGKSEEEILKTNLLELISSLKPETTIFCIDTKPSMALFLEILLKFDGKFLLKSEQPLSVKVPVTFSEEYKERNGCFPVLSSRGAFFVWQKLSSFEPDPNYIMPPTNPPTDVKEISQDSLEKLLNENEVSKITKTLKDLILPSSQNLQRTEVGYVFSNSHVSDNNKSLQPSISDIRESVSSISSFVSTPKQLEINKGATSQNFVSTQSVQELPLINFEEKNCFSHSLKKSSSIDNSFFQYSSKDLSFLGESVFPQNSLHSCTMGETVQYNVTKKKISEIKKKNNVSKSNQASKSTSESKATQTELHQSASSSSPVKGLTERVKRLVSSLENEVQKNIPIDPVKTHLHAGPNRCTNYLYCSANCNNDSGADIKPQYCDGYQTERENAIRCSNYVHCCAVRHMMHRCEMHCCQSCVHRCNTNPCRPFCESNIASTSTSLTQPQIVIPLQNVSEDLLLQLISAAKSGSKPQ